MTDLTPFQQQFFDQEGAFSNKSLLIHLHLFYDDLWEWFLPYLSKIHFDYDMVVTIPKGELADFTTNRIKAFSNKITVVQVSNAGLDVLPFLETLNNAIQSNSYYNCILKLHSKKSLAHAVGLGDRWRTQLVSSLLSEQSVFEYAFTSCIKHPQYKMAASGIWCLPQKWIGYEQKYFTGLNPLPEYTFVGGTMFLANFQLFKDWMVSQNIYERFKPCFIEGYVGDGSLAHELERVFGLLVHATGNKILQL